LANSAWFLTLRPLGSDQIPKNKDVSCKAKAIIPLKASIFEKFSGFMT
jgi:hypothetical protein